MIMKTLCLLLCLACFGMLYGQDTVLTQGIYLSAQEIIDRAPSDTVTVLKLIQRKKSDLKMGGGNDYKLEGWTSEETKSDYLREQILAVEYDDTLYVNGYYVTGTRGFAKVESQGDTYMLFYSALPLKRKQAQEIGLEEAYRQQQKKSATAGMFGLLGTVIATATDDLGALDRYPIVYDIAQGKAYYPQGDNVNRLTEGFPDLQEKYAQWQVDSVSRDEVVGFVEALNRARRTEP